MAAGVAQGLSHRHVAEVAPPLEQENFEHEKRRISRVADGIGHPPEFIAKHFFEGLPVDEAIDLVQEAILALAMGGNKSAMPGFLGVRSLMIASVVSDGENILQLHKITTYYPACPYISLAIEIIEKIQTSLEERINLTPVSWDETKLNYCPAFSAGLGLYTNKAPLSKNVQAIVHE